jgi:L-ascorbate 6-phosphate lactonase
MKITWIGQAGLLIETDGKVIIVDPYLSDSVEKIEPHNVRRVPVDRSLLELQPDLILCTHNHLDHTDPETLVHYLTPESRRLVLAPKSSYQNLRATYGGRHNYVLMEAGCEWTEGNVVIRAVPAVHSDPDAIGFILSAEGKNYYITGDTLYSTKVLSALPDLPLHAVFLPINGVGNNMNAVDAARFAAATKATYAVPLHFGLFDDLTGDVFQAENRVIPQFYQPICLP